MHLVYIIQSRFIPPVVTFEALERNMILKINLLFTIFCETLYAVTHLRAGNIFSTLLRNN